ncbi:hypothetical protein H8356DRAFT_1361756 [Neocallimastix lanati (nom. inval.)]|nr:hypothetical protein H8356DRAFT_1361756 [Neocallimastix sp. JGI-2020a]
MNDVSVEEELPNIPTKKLGNSISKTSDEYTKSLLKNCPKIEIDDLMILLNPHDKAGHVEHFGKRFFKFWKGATTFELTINHDVHSTLLLDNLNSLFTEYSNEITVNFGKYKNNKLLYLLLTLNADDILIARASKLIKRAILRKNILSNYNINNTKITRIPYITFTVNQTRRFSENTTEADLNAGNPPSDNIFIISNSLILWKSITMKNTSLSTIETQYSNLIEFKDITGKLKQIKKRRCNYMDIKYKIYPPSDNIFIISNSLILWKSITMKNTSLSTIETQYSNLIEYPLTKIISGPKFKYFYRFYYGNVGKCQCRPSNSVLIYNNDDVNNYIFCICEASTVILLFKFIYKTRVAVTASFNMTIKVEFVSKN